MTILTIYQNQTKTIQGNEYFLCNFYNIKMNNNYWLTTSQIHEMNKSNNLKIKYIEKKKVNNQSENIDLNNQDQTLANILNQYSNFDDCKK